MYCPNCGAQNSTEQKFCRSCGMNVEMIAHSLVEQFPTAISANLMRQEQQIQRFGTIAFGGFCAVMGIGAIGIIIALFYKLVLSGDGIKALVGILIILFIIFAVLTLTYVYFNESLKEKMKRVAAAPQPLSLDANNGEQLTEGQPPISAPSVIEDTTDLLKVPAGVKTGKLES